MKESLRKEIKCLTQQIAVSGYEWNFAKFLAERAASYVDDEELMPNGTLVLKIIGTKPGPKVMLGVHMDEVGYIVNEIDEYGYLHFCKIGRSSDNILPARRVLIKTSNGVIPGVIGASSTHMLSDEELKKMQSVSESFIDIGAEDKDEVLFWGVRKGDQVVIESECTELKNSDYLITKAADCRALCAILMECIRKIDRKQLAGEVYVAFSAMEEVTTKGLNAAVHKIQPNYILVLDTVPAGDVPGVNSLENCLKLGRGAVLILAQQNIRSGNYAVAHPKLLQAARETAEKFEISTQEVAFVSAFYSTDACGIINIDSGNAAMTIALPRRYSHSPTEIIHLDDCIAVEKLVNGILKKTIDVCML